MCPSMPSSVAVWLQVGAATLQGWSPGRHDADLESRHIDSARYYQNEDKVGQAIRESGIPREQIFVSEWNNRTGAKGS